MLSTDFQKIRTEFQNADTDKKIDMYVNAEGLSVDQFQELLKLFPIEHLHRLESALGA